MYIVLWIINSCNVDTLDMNIVKVLVSESQPDFGKWLLSCRCSYLIRGLPAWLHLLSNCVISYLHQPCVHHCLAPLSWSFLSEPKQMYQSLISHPTSTCAFPCKGAGRETKVCPYLFSMKPFLVTWCNGMLHCYRETTVKESPLGRGRQREH